MEQGAAEEGKGGQNDASPPQKSKSKMRRSDTASVLNAVLGQQQVTDLGFLQRLSDRLSSVGLTFPGVEVRWQDLVVQVDVPKHGPKAHSVASATAAVAIALVQPLYRLCSGQPGAPNTVRRTVLDAGSGLLRPGRMTLLLGPPGSGKTTLMRALAGQLLPPAPGDSSSSRKSKGGMVVGGSLTYNGLVPQRDFVVQRSASFVSQHDLHIGEMTVEETLTFAARCLGPGLNKRLHELLLSKERAAGKPPQPELDALWEAAYGPNGHDLMVELFARLLGIDHVMDTVVGNELLKGISGGQKRRVTVGEMAVGLAQVMCLDEITNGLDSASALAITRALRNLCAYFQATMLVSLLQPSPEVFECFDDILLLSQGQVVFLGPREEVMPFFARMGLAPPPTKTDADFLQEVTSSPAYQAKYRVPGGLAESCGSAWLSPRRLREAYLSGETGQTLSGRLAAAPHTHELQDLVLHKEPHALSTLGMWAANAGREGLLLVRNKTFFIAGAVQTAFTAFLVSTTFIRMSKNTFEEANLFMSVMFFSLMTMFMGGFNFAPVYCQRLAVFYKQRDHRFYTSASYAVATCLMRLPDLAFQSTIWALMVYFSAGFTEDAGRFFLYWANLVSAGFYSVCIFQLLGAITRHEVIAQGLGAVMLMMSVMGSGFPIARTSIPGWWIWWYWADPMAWCLRSMAIVELTSSDWNTPATDFDRPDMTIGRYALQERGFYQDWAWVWAGLGTVLGLSLILLAGQIVALHFLGPPSGYRPPADDEETTEGLEGGGPKCLFRQPTAAAVGSSPSASNPSTSDGAASPAAAATSPAAAVAAKGDVAVTVRVTSNLQFTPVVMAFEDVCYYVPAVKGGSGELQLLNRVSGVFRPGVLTSLMGASGAGKTTLMDVLAGRKTGGRCEGRQMINGAPKRNRAFARLMGYVEQFDAHNPQATVEEALLFSARLRVKAGVLGPGGVLPFVREMADVVELGPLAHHVVGMSGVGGALSTEARKRLTIACELVANPSIIFLDEPTTGLDARAAGMVMRAVRNTVATGRTVVCTIHQPNREIMDYFDELLLLKPGGRTIYFGPLGPQQSSLIAYLEGMEGVPRYEPLMNPANYMLEVTAPAAEKQLGVDFGDLWAASKLAQAATELITQHMQPAAAKASAADVKLAVADVVDAGLDATVGGAGSVSSSDGDAAAAAGGADEAAAVMSADYAAPPHVQLYHLVVRGLVSYWRNPAYNLLRMAVTIGLGLALGTLYWDRGTKRQSLLGVLDIMGALYTSSLFLAMVNCLTVMPVVAADRAVFYRERASRMYRTTIFAMAQGLAEMPWLFLQSVIYTIIIYTTTHFEFESTKALWFWLYIWLNIMCFTFLGMGMMNLTPNMPAAVALTSLWVLLWNLFCGFLIYRQDIKPWWLWAYYFNPATYAIYGCIVTQLGDVTNEFIDVGNNNIMSVAQYVEDTFNYRYEWRGWIVLIMVSFIMLFRLMSYLGLSYLNFQVR